MSQSIADQLVLTTARIECVDDAGIRSSGTGFFFNFCDIGQGKIVPTLITNKHVIRGAKQGSFHLNTRGDDGKPNFGKHISVPFNNFESAWVMHPENDVDLAALPLGSIVPWLESQGMNVHTTAIDRKLMALTSDLSELSAIEDILMIGYPNSLWDSHNNIPISRRGITATPPYLDFEGRKEFVIDCACFPGSSGSPIFLYNMGGYASKTGGVQLGGRVKFLGVLWGGPQHTATGEIQIVLAPTRNEPIAISRIPNNLGFCIKAEKLLAFEDHFERLVAAEEARRQQ